LLRNNRLQEKRATKVTLNSLLLSSAIARPAPAENRVSVLLSHTPCMSSTVKTARREGEGINSKTGSGDTPPRNAGEERSVATTKKTILASWSARERPSNRFLWNQARLSCRSLDSTALPPLRVD